MDIRRMPQFTMPADTPLEALPVILTLSPMEWNHLRDLVSEHIEATGWCQRKREVQQVAITISRAPRIERTAPAQPVGGGFVIVITVKYEADKPANKGAPPLPNAVRVVLINTQTGEEGKAVLRPGESVEHRLRVDPLGILNMQLQGTAPAQPVGEDS